ncbi:hypothetical protein ABZ348_17305 [Streptomyces sp. NPDC005963]|uniref:hypothetical protein n=1 Tax=Streptomyces sp. NPDC005963 TaxID=3156721 RepID=UPI0033E1D0EF
MPEASRRSGLHRAGLRYFHEIENRLTGVSGPGVPPDNEAGVIGWGTSWRMQGYLMMAQSTGNTAYVERLADLIDQVLEARDEVRGIEDHRGESGPVWSTAGKFTAATAIIPDTDGHPALAVTVCPPHAKTARVTVQAEDDDLFSITVTGPPQRKKSGVISLGLDPLGERSADRLIYEAYMQRTGVTARLLPRDSGAPSAGPRRARPGTYPVRPAMVSLAAQTGMIAYPMAGLARLAREHPALVPDSVAKRVPTYLEAAERAVRAHDEQWDTTTDGRGFYRWLPDEPVSFAGAELPTNEFLAMGRTLVQLALATGAEEHVERAAAMARAFHTDLTIKDGVADWPYWPSFGRVYRGWQATGSPKADGSYVRPSYAPVTVPEDVTHSLIDIDFLCLYHDAPGLPEVFTPSDMKAVAATFTRQVVERRRLRPRMRHDVGGTGKPGTDRQQAHVAGWLPLTRWSPRVARKVRAIQPELPPPPLMGVDTYCGALLARWG